MENSKVYLVKYGEGAYDDYYENTIFVTLYKHKAEAYVRKFNSLLLKLKARYQHSYDGDEDDPFFLYKRYVRLSETYAATIEEIEIR